MRSFPTDERAGAPRSGPVTSNVDLSVVIPVYNNASTLDDLLDRLLRVLEPLERSFEIIFVDDGSDDDSLAILRARARDETRIRVFALARNFGSQAAACAGFDLVRGRWTVCMDADLENCPEDIPALLESLERGYDLVCGYRQSRHAPLLTRRLPSWLMNVYARRRMGTSIRDVGCGMRALQSWIVRDLEAEGEGRRLLTPVMLRRARTITELPLRAGARHTAGGHSFMTLLAIAADYFMLTARRPFLISGLVALAAIVGGTILCFFGATITGLIIGTGGVLAALLSLVGEYCQRLYQLVQGAPFYALREPGETESPARDRTADGDGNGLAR